MRKMQYVAAIIIMTATQVIAQDTSETANILNAISVTSASFHTNKNSLMDRKIMSFDVKNGSKLVIKALFFHARLQTPGRTLPWIESDQNYTFPGGLEPGEKRHLNLAPNMFGDWGQAEDDWIKTGVLSVSVLGIEDHTGRQIAQKPEAAPK